MENYFSMNMTKLQVDAISNLGLAHIGDAVFELLCRSYLCARGDVNVGQLHHKTVQLVKASAQAAFADAMQQHLTDEEKMYYRRGKNAHVHALPRSATPADYSKATGVEAMFGAMYLYGKTERLNEIFNLVMEDLYGI